MHERTTHRGLLRSRHRHLLSSNALSAARRSLCARVNARAFVCGGGHDTEQRASAYRRTIVLFWRCSRGGHYTFTVADYRHYHTRLRARCRLPPSSRHLLCRQFKPTSSATFLPTTTYYLQLHHTYIAGGALPARHAYLYQTGRRNSLPLPAYLQLMCRLLTIHILACHTLRLAPFSSFSPCTC